jgi:diadenosine tetraphosphate (Ap4A) HIT family hydrolase
MRVKRAGPVAALPLFPAASGWATVPGPPSSRPRETMPTPACTMCAEIAGRIVPPGGVIHEDEFWIVSHHTGPYTDPGELMVKARRHSESVAELSQPEATALGPVLRAAVTAIERVVRPERVYMASYGERQRHLHFYLLPRTANLPAGHVISDVYRRARTMMRRWGVARNPTAAARAEVAGRIREDPAWKTLST